MHRRDDTRPLLSVVIPCYNEEEALSDLVAELALFREKLAHRFPDFELEAVLVDDGSRDRTWDLVVAASQTNPWIGGVHLARNFGHQRALACGYDAAAGDFVACMDADLQDPPDVLLEMLEAGLRGADVVYGVRRERPGESWFKLKTAEWFYRLFRLVTATEAPMGAGDFRLLSRRALSTLRSFPEQHLFIRGLVGIIGFNQTQVLYDRMPRVRGTTKYPLHKMVHLAADAFVSMSMQPLRFAFVLTTFGLLISFGFLAYSLFLYLADPDELVPGWFSTVTIVTFFGACCLLMLGVIGEYIGRIYEQVKGRPLYIVQDERNIRKGSLKTGAFCNAFSENKG